METALPYKNRQSRRLTGTEPYSGKPRIFACTTTTIRNLALVLTGISLRKVIRLSVIDQMRMEKESRREEL